MAAVRSCHVASVSTPDGTGATSRSDAANFADSAQSKFRPACSSLSSPVVQSDIQLDNETLPWRTLSIPVELPMICVRVCRVALKAAYSFTGFEHCAYSCSEIASYRGWVSHSCRCEHPDIIRMGTSFSLHVTSIRSTYGL